MTTREKKWNRKIKKFNDASFAILLLIVRRLIRKNNCTVGKKKTVIHCYKKDIQSIGFSKRKDKYEGKTINRELLKRHSLTKNLELPLK
jgi:hypothetical protein